MKSQSKNLNFSQKILIAAFLYLFSIFSSFDSAYAANKAKNYEQGEAKVLAHNEGKGKLKGMLGSILVENNDKIQFKIRSGFSKEDRKNPPKIGSTIIYKYHGKTKKNKPKYPSFVKVK